MVQLVVGLVTSPLISQTLNHRDFAIVGYFNSFLALFTPIVGLMLGSYYARTYFRVDQGKRDKLKHSIVSILVTYGILSTIVVLMLFGVYLKLNDPGFPFFPYAVLSFGTMMFGQIYNFYLLNMRLSKRARSYFFLSLFHHVFYGIMMILLCVVFKYGASGSLAATLITSMSFSIYCLKQLGFRYEIDKSIFIEALKFCWPLIIAGSLQYFFSGVDRALLAGLKDDTNLGLYNIAMRITSYIGVFYAAISMTIEPDLYHAIAKKKYKRLALIVSGLLAFKLSLVLLFNLFAPFIISILTSGRYNAAVPLARVMSLKNISSFIYSTMSVVIIGLGYSKVTLVNRIVGTAGVYIMFRILIGQHGFVGAAWGQFFSYLILSFFSMAFIAMKMWDKKRRLTKAS